jgi:branched-chain amino acid transport system ATP-binding protein
VIENLLLGCHLKTGIGFFGDLFNFPSTRRKRDRVFEKTMDIVNFTGLAPHKDKLAENLSSGYQKILAIGIALATDPRLLLLDEPATTLTSSMVNRVMELITAVRDAGTTVVIIEHNMKAIMDYCDRIVVLANGTKIAEGLPHEIKENREVIEAYLGVMV